MCDVDLFVLFCRLVSIALVRSKETLGAWYGVRGPLPLSWGEEYVSLSVIFEARGNLGQFDRGVAFTSARSQRKSRVFDRTMGFPGEDIPLAFSVGTQLLGRA